MLLPTSFWVFFFPLGIVVLLYSNYLHPVCLFRVRPSAVVDPAAVIKILATRPFQNIFRVFARLFLQYINLSAVFDPAAVLKSRITRIRKLFYRVVLRCSPPHLHRRTAHAT